MVDSLVKVSTCALCGSDQFRDEMRSDDWTLKKCESCGLVFTSPRLSDRALAEYYRDSYYEQGRASYQDLQLAGPTFGDRELALRLLRRSGRIGSTPVRSLDVGCGGGALVEAFSEAGFEARGIEPSQAMAEAAAALGRNISATALEDVPVASVEVVTCIHVLEHVIDPLSFAKNLTRCLVPGGLLAVEVPDYGSKAARRAGRDWKALYPTVHLHQFEQSTLTDLLRRCGLKVSHTRRLGGSAGGTGSGAKTKAPIQSGLTITAVAARKVPPRSLIWPLRKLAHGWPGLRAWCRNFYWNTLGNGEYLQVVAMKDDVNQ